MAVDNLCDVCYIDLRETGSHYHCAKCLDPKPTSMYGHWSERAGGFTCQVDKSVER